MPSNAALSRTPACFITSLLLVACRLANSTCAALAPIPTASANTGHCASTVRPIIPGPRIAFAITTSRRPLMFRRAVLSFRLRCLDCLERVDQWFVVDDGSSPDQVAIMRAAVPGMTWLTKAEPERGHPGSLNVLLRAVRDYDYVVFVEDDFFFIKDEDLVARSLAVLDDDVSLGQVIFNERYLHTDMAPDRGRTVGGVEHVNATTGDVDYIVHDYKGQVGSPAWSAFFEEHPGKQGSVHWPHFSLHRREDWERKI